MLPKTCSKPVGANCLNWLSVSPCSDAVLRALPVLLLLPLLWRTCESSLSPCLYSACLIYPLLSMLQLFAVFFSCFQIDNDTLWRLPAEKQTSHGASGIACRFTLGIPDHENSNFHVLLSFVMMIGYSWWIVVVFTIDSEHSLVTCHYVSYFCRSWWPYVLLGLCSLATGESSARGLNLEAFCVSGSWVWPSNAVDNTWATE